MVIGFELTLDRGATGGGFAVGPRMVLPLEEPTLVVGLFTGLLSHALRRGSGERGSAVGLRLDCNWAQLSAVLSMVARVRDAASRWGLRFGVRADTGRMVVTVVAAHEAGARLSRAGATREPGA